MDPTVDDVDSNARHRGYNDRWWGHGFLEPTDVGLVLSTKVFVHCKQLTSDDCFPFLVKGLEVEFSFIMAKDSTLQDEMDPIGGQQVR